MQQCLIVNCYIIQFFGRKYNMVTMVTILILKVLCVSKDSSPSRRQEYWPSWLSTLTVPRCTLMHASICTSGVHDNSIVHVRFSAHA